MPMLQLLIVAYNGVKVVRFSHLTSIDVLPSKNQAQNFLATVQGCFMPKLLLQH